MPRTMRGSPSSLPTTVPAWMWSTPASRIHLAMTRKLTPCVFCRVYVPWPARCRCRIMSCLRAQCDMLWMAV